MGMVVGQGCGFSL